MNFTEGEIDSCYSESIASHNLTLLCLELYEEQVPLPGWMIPLLVVLVVSTVMANIMVIAVNEQALRRRSLLSVFEITSVCFYVCA